jgi:hypothetical protein
MSDRPTPEQLQVLRDCYEIHGDGVARIRLDKAIKDEKFRETLKRLSGLTSDDIEKGVI